MMMISKLVSGILRELFTARPTVRGGALQGCKTLFHGFHLCLNGLNVSPGARAQSEFVTKIPLDRVQSFGMVRECFRVLVDLTPEFSPGLREITLYPPQDRKHGISRLGHRNLSV